MLFREIIGQGEIKNKLTAIAASGKISHAYLLISQEGSGALPLAIAFARYIHCKNKTDNDSCSECPSCLKIQKLSHPDLHFVFPVATTKSVDKEPVSDDFITQWRESLLQNPYMNLAEWYESLGIENKQGGINIYESKEVLRKLGLKSFESDYKIMIIWMPEKMNTQAANKLLKLLEEPPEKTVFILITQDSSQLLPTILSRTQLIKIPKIARPDLQEALTSSFGFSNSVEIESILDYANGDYLKVLEAIDKGRDTSGHFNAFVSLMRVCYGADLSKLNEWVEEIASAGREKQKHFILFALKMLRGNFMMNIQENSISYLKQNEKEFSLKFSKFIHSGNIETLTLEFNQAFIHIEYNANAKIVFFHLGLRIAKLLKT
jgi:DNA polymerase III subunit delta'